VTTLEQRTQGFTREGVLALSEMKNEPDWLRQRRLEAWEVFERTPWPDIRRDEEWRRTDISGLRLDQITPFATPTPPTPLGGSSSGGAVAEGRSAVLAQHDSTFTQADLIDDLTRQGVLVMDLEQAVRQHPALVQQYFMTECVPFTYSKFAALHGAYWSGGVFVYVPRNVQVALPVQSTLTLATPGAGLFAHTLIVTEQGSSLTYIDEGLPGDAALNGGAGVQSLVNNVTELYARPGSHLRYVNIQEWGPHTYSFSTQRLLADRDSAVRWLVVALGSQLGKANIDAVMREPGADVEMLGLVFGSGTQLLDCHTMQDHVAPNTRSDLLYKTVLKDSARSVFSGMIRVFPHAQHTDAYQQNRNLLLSTTARADSIPNLEIGANEVRCTHAATVGQVEDEYLFYLMSRGLPRPAAERMIVEGFFESILERVPLEDIQERLRDYIISKMDA